MKPTVAFDEAGHSGGNLLDPEQPVFVLASARLSENEAVELLGSPGKELKFATLKRSKRGMEIILRILDSPLLSEDRFLISAFHKPFMIVTKIVDLLVEPLAHRDGVDLYERGANIAMANVFFFCLPVFLGRDTFETLCARFVGMVRAPSSKTVNAFYALIEEAYHAHRHEEFAADLVLLLATRRIAEEYIEDCDSSDLDPSIPAFFEHASVWTGRLGSSFTIVHDQSKAIANQQVVLEAVMSTTEEPAAIGYDRRKMIFPISAVGIVFRDSKECPPLQVADLLASSAAYCLREAERLHRDEFAAQLLQTQALSAPLLPLWPELKVSPEELGTAEVGGIDANNFIGEYVSKRLGGFPPKGMRRKL